MYDKIWVNRQKDHRTHGQLAVGSLNSKSLQTDHRTKFKLQSTHWTNKNLHLGHCAVKNELTLTESVKDNNKKYKKFEKNIKIQFSQKILKT